MERDITTMTDKEYNKYYWSDYYDLCKKCKERCKQSHVVKQVVCKKYNKIED